MHVQRSRYSLALLLSFLWVSISAARVAGPAEPFPDRAAFFRKVREAIKLDYELQKGFTYLEHRRDLRVSRLGKVSVGPLRTFEVFPSSRPGGTYKRLIAVDGRPLDSDELARRDREHEAHLRSARKAAADERARRRGEKARERQERQAILDDAFGVYEPAFLRRETLDGERVIVAAITPRPDARVTTREGRWMKDFVGRLWISEADHQIARIELEAIDDVTIGWGILGRVDEGSRFMFARTKVDGVWLPAEVAFDATGRTLLFRKFDIHAVTTFSEYRRQP